MEVCSGQYCVVNVPPLRPLRTEYNNILLPTYRARARFVTLVCYYAPRTERNVYFTVASRVLARNVNLCMRDGSSA